MRLNEPACHSKSRQPSPPRICMIVAMAVGRARHTGDERAGLFTNRNTKYAEGFRDSPNPDSGRVKKVGGIAGRRTVSVTSGY